MKLFIVGFYVKNSPWYIEGVFSSFEKALESVLKTDHFVIAINLDEPLPIENIIAPSSDCVYPRAEPIPVEFRLKWLDGEIK